MQRKKAAQAEKILYGCNSIHRHPAAMAISQKFGERGNNYAEALRESVTAFFKFAHRYCRDGWLSRKEALRLCSLGKKARQTASRRLKDLLTLDDHFTQRKDGVVLLKSMFLSEGWRRAALEKFTRRKDKDALKKRQRRESPNNRPVNRRREFGPPALPESDSEPPPDLSPLPQESIKAIYSRSEPPKPQTEVRPPPQLPPMPGANATVAERRAWLAASAAIETPEPAAREPVRKPQPKPVAKDENGVPLCFYALGFVYFEGVWKRYTEAEWWRGYRKVKRGQRLEKNRGAAITYATRKIASGAWQPAI